MEGLYIYTLFYSPVLFYIELISTDIKNIMLLFTKKKKKNSFIIPTFQYPFWNT